MLNSLLPPMHYALIAAGEGSRLREEGIKTSKPLVKIQGIPMIERLIKIFMQNGAVSISVICNDAMIEVRNFLESLQESEALKSVDAEGTPYVCKLNIVVQTTPSSMHSLAALRNVIPAGKFCLTTVDTIFQEEEFSSFIRSFATMDETEGDGLFAVTPFVDDEKPLWVGVEPAKKFSCACAMRKFSKIDGFYDQEEQIPAGLEKMVSGGIYCLDTRTAFPVLQRCLAAGQSRMRNYQRALISAGLKLQAYVFPKIMDIDHASDIEKAEEWLASSQRKMLAVSRDTCYSPNNEEKDAAIWQSVLSRLRQRGWQIEECKESEWMELNMRIVFDRFHKIIHMTRHQRSLDLLGQARIPVLNPEEAVRIVSKSRAKTSCLLREAGIPVPDWCCVKSKELQVSYDGSLSSYNNFGWCKAMREKGAQPTDVCRITTTSETDALVRSLIDDIDVDEIIMTAHVEGELIKCYVVLENNTFQPRLLHWFRPLQSGYSKFSVAETHNVLLPDLSIDENVLNSFAQKIGQTLGLLFFGFDLIVQPDNQMYVIDVNDWPSYSSCRDEAAEAIASVINEERTSN